MRAAINYRFYSTLSTLIKIMKRSSKQTNPQNLWWNIIRCSNCHIRMDQSIFVQLQTRSKISQSYVARTVQQYVVGFDISVCITKCVQSVYCECHLSSVESSHFLGKPILVFAQKCQKIPARIIVHYQILNSKRKLPDLIKQLHQPYK